VNNTNQQPPKRKIIRKVLLLVVVGLILFGAVKHHRSHDTIPVVLQPQSKIEVVFEEDVEIDDYSTTNDFLEQNTAEENLQIVQNEEFSPQLLEQKIQADVIGDWLEKNVDFDIPQQNNNFFAELPQHNQDILEQMYEEELPDDILVSNPKLKNIGFVPSHKPPYFGEKPVIVVVIDDMGISYKRTADIASLQAPLTASFLTYGKNLQKQIENSQKAGQEIMIHVPMEAQNATDIAPDVLTTQMGVEEIKKNIEDMIAKFDKVAGINNHMGSKLTEDKDRMLAIMEVLKKHNMFFLDSKTSAASKAEEAAEETGIAYAHRHIFIDNNNDKEYILGQLQKAENVARKNGYAIAIGHPKSQTYEALKEWLPMLESKGLVLEPLSKIVNILHPSTK